MIAERRRSPLASGVKRDGSSPPSPVFERPPRRFIAIASVSCASREIDPRLIAPVQKRLTISLAGSTSSSGTGSAGLRPAADLQQAAQRGLARGVLVDRARVLAVLLERRALAHGRDTPRGRPSAPRPRRRWPRAPRAGRARSSRGSTCGARRRAATRTRRRPAAADRAPARPPDTRARDARAPLSPAPPRRPRRCARPCR